MIEEDRDGKKKTTTAKQKIKKLLMRKKRYEEKSGNLPTVYNRLGSFDTGFFC